MFDEVKEEHARMVAVGLKPKWKYLSTFVNGEPGNEQGFAIAQCDCGECTLLVLDVKADTDRDRVQATVSFELTDELVDFLSQKLPEHVAAWEASRNET